METPATEQISPEVAAEVLGNLDRATNPCDDFYRFACGGWMDNTPMPPDQSRFGRFHVLREKNKEALGEIAKQAATKASETDEDAKLGRFWNACLDEDAIESAGVAPLQEALQRIDQVKDRESLFATVGWLARRGPAALLEAGVAPDAKDPGVNLFYLTQGGLGLPDREYYLGQDEQSQALRAAYRAHVVEMLTLLGETKVEKTADEIIAFETRLAEVALPRDQLRDPEKLYNRLTAAELKKRTPKLPWEAYFAALGLEDRDHLNVAPESYFHGLSKVLQSTSPKVWKAYLRWQTLHNAAEHLPKAFVASDFAFFKKILRGQQEPAPRWKDCVNMADRAMGEVLGREFVARRFPAESRQVAVEMIEGIEHAFSEGLAALTWMDDDTRARAVEKMKAVVNKIGYPSKWKDYSGLEIGPNHLENVSRAHAFELDRRLQEVGKEVDREEWHMTPSTVNAYYNPSNNEMVFPAGILQPPFFHPDYPMAMNFGGIGMVMGHELTHGFDDQGRKFDGEGRLRQWWGDEAVQRFEERSKCVEELYSSYEVQPGLHLNGKLTLGENIADLGGIKEAFRAYVHWAESNGVDPNAPAIEGLTQAQLFFVSFGQIWCTQATPEIERVLALTDPHSHPRYRVNGPLSNLPEFWETFSCEPGAPMRPQNTCEVW